MRKFLTLKLFPFFENLFESSVVEEEAGFMPASRRRSISPPTQLRKADLAHRNFARAGLSIIATTPIKISRLFVYFVVKK